MFMFRSRWRKKENINRQRASRLEVGERFARQDSGDDASLTSIMLLGRVLPPSPPPPMYER